MTLLYALILPVSLLVIWFIVQRNWKALVITIGSLIVLAVIIWCLILWFVSIALQSYAEITNKSEIEYYSLVEDSIQQLMSSIERYKIEPIDSIINDIQYSVFESFVLGDNTIEVFKADSFNINWLKINSETFSLDELKTVNPRTDGEMDNMFCNYLEKIKLYRHGSDELLFMEFKPFPCSGLGCGVFDYLIFNVSKKQLNLFGTFSVENLDLYRFPIHQEISFIATEYSGDPHGYSPVHFTSRIYSMNDKGEFTLTKDNTGKEYFYEEISYPNDSLKEPSYKANWFQ